MQEHKRTVRNETSLPLCLREIVVLEIDEVLTKSYYRKLAKAVADLHVNSKSLCAFADLSLLR